MLAGIGTMTNGNRLLGDGERVHRRFSHSGIPLSDRHNVRGGERAGNIFCNCPLTAKIQAGQAGREKGEKSERAVRGPPGD